jgi:hypothetical protein
LEVGRHTTETSKMTEKLRQLEFQLGELSKRTNLADTELQMLPEKIREIHSYNLFGQDLLSIPLDIDENEEFERPFRFTDDLEDFKIFESEFRTEIPTEFIQIGSLYGSTEIVLFNKLTETIHIFHISDIADPNWLKYKLDNQKFTFDTFIDKLRLQTVCCFMNPKDFSQCDIFEIRNETSIKTEENLKIYENLKQTWNAYLDLVKLSIDKGFELHYAPKKLKNEIEI